MAQYSDTKPTHERFTAQLSQGIMMRHQEPGAQGTLTQQEREDDKPLLLTIPQVAQQLGISRAHVYKLINQGLPTIHLGRSVRVSMTSLQLWLSDQEIQ